MRARESQKERREWELDDRLTQTAALVTALNAVVVARVNAEHRAAWQAEKKQAQEAQRKRREQGLEDRRAQTTALMALAMGVVSRMQESEREPEVFRENDET